MISDIEKLDKDISNFLEGKGDDTYNNYSEVFTEKFLVIEEMIHVMLDGEVTKAVALSHLLKSYKDIRNGLYNDLRNRMKKR